MGEDAIQHERNIFGAGIDDLAIPLEETCIMKTSKRVHWDTERVHCYEDLKEHFGRPLDDAAVSLNGKLMYREIIDCDLALVDFN